MCDRRKKFTDLFVGYPGSVHDSRVFRNSSLKNNLKGKGGRYFLLGTVDIHYKNFNVRLAKNRYVIEHCFGILKQKCRQLHHIKLRNIRFIVHFIRVACVPHNIALEDEFYLLTSKQIF